jgi:hypothetical protein
MLGLVDEAGSTAAAAGELSTKVAPASESDTPKALRAFFPRCESFVWSDERAILSPPQSLLRKTPVGK